MKVASRSGSQPVVFVGADAVTAITLDRPAASVRTYRYSITSGSGLRYQRRVTAPPATDGSPRQTGGCGGLSSRSAKGDELCVAFEPDSVATTRNEKEPLSVASPCLCGGDSVQPEPGPGNGQWADAHSMEAWW